MNRIRTKKKESKISPRIYRKEFLGSGSESRVYAADVVTEKGTDSSPN